ncbi:MAG: N-formylglutamate amidohydrolase [Micavibrio aeruginosavorus]|uniref:N-formylglutamate amidohydrolase n=1 Tax=Micavibrio aeruginosavorus TaxID=349221 RepID=A0A2W5MXV4_9BACT|nr:MAG: N-formylglutamate amidohydrolase [Micavibrio aeruginosavorus]
MTPKRNGLLQKESLSGIYTLVRPELAVPLVFDSPHSGTFYPPDFDYACDFAMLEKAEDKFVDELFMDAPQIGASYLYAQFPRSYIDPNRCERDIDIDLLDEPWTHEINATPRSHAGIGLIRRLVRPGVPLYNRGLKEAEIRHRIDNYYRPYHAALERVIEDLHYRFGQVWHVNCHSMPSADGHSFRASPLKAADFVLGDRDGTTCDLDFTHSIREFLRNLGYKVAINDPYKGVELVRRYSNPATSRHSLQIEVARNLYLDEQTYKKSNNYNRLRGDIHKLIQFCADYVQAQSLPLAAD